MPKLTKYSPLAFATIAKRTPVHDDVLTLNTDALDAIRREVEQLAMSQPRRNARHGGGGNNSSRGGAAGEFRRSNNRNNRESDGGNRGNNRRRRGGSSNGGNGSRRRDRTDGGGGWQRGNGTDARADAGRDGGGGGNFRRAALGTQDEDLKAFQSGLNKVNDDNVDDVLKRMVAMPANDAFVGMLVESATQQAQYTPLYVRIFNALMQQWTSTSPERVDGAKKQVVDAVLHVATERVTKLNAKGFGKFAVHLCLTGVLTQEMLETHLQRWVDALVANDNAFNVCELLVFLCQELAAHAKSAWAPIVAQRVAPLWDDANTLRQRYKIRLLDVKDAFA